MPKQTLTLKSFSALASPEARAVIHAEDRRKAANLRRAANLPKTNPGPRIAR